MKRKVVIEMLPEPDRSRWPCYRFSLVHGLSQEKYQQLRRRLGYRGDTLLPVVGGGRNLIVAVDVRTKNEDAARWCAEQAFAAPGEPKLIRVKVKSMEKLSKQKAAANRWRQLAH